MTPAFERIFLGLCAAAAVLAGSEAIAGELADPGSRLPARALVRIGTDDLRTHGFIGGIAFSPDGTLVAASGTEPSLQIFDVKTGRQVKQIGLSDPSRGSVERVAFSPDATKLLWGEFSGHVTLWDLARDRVLFRAKPHQGAVRDVAFSPDGSAMATAGEDGDVHLRNVGSPAAVVRIFKTGEKPPSDPSFRSGGVRCLAFTPDGTRIVAGSGVRASISIWRIEDGQLLRRIEDAHGNANVKNPAVNSLAVTPDGRRIMSAGYRRVPREQTKLEDGPESVTISEVRLWDLDTGGRLKDLLGPDAQGSGHAALSRDGKRVAVGDFSLLRILDVDTGRTESTISLPGWWGRGPVFSPDGTLVAVPIWNTVGLFDVRTGRRRLQEETTPAGSLTAASWSPSGDRVVTGHEDGRVRVWEAATGRLIWHQILAPVISPNGWNARAAFVAFSRDGRRVVVAGRRDNPVEPRYGIVAVFEATKGHIVRRIDQDEVRGAALSPDRKTLVVSTSRGLETQLVAIEVETGRTLATWPLEDRQAGYRRPPAMRFQGDSASLDVALTNGKVITFDAPSGRELRQFLADWRTDAQKRDNRPAHPNLQSAAFLDDGRTLVTSSANSVYVWDLTLGTRLRTLRYPHAHGCCLAVTPNGKTLATSDLPYEGDFGVDTIRLYDLATGEQVLTLDPDGGRAGLLTFSPDGTKLLTGFHRGSAIVWDIRRGPQAAQTGLPHRNTETPVSR